MNHDEMVDLLSLISARDNRTVGRATVLAWLEDLDGIDFRDARRAVTQHYRESTDWLMPAHIRDHVRAIREERLGPPGPGLSSPVPPPADPDDPRAYMAALRAQEARIADGRETVPAIEAGEHGERGGYESNPHVQRILADFKAAQDAAARRKAQEAAHERQGVRAYLAAVEQLLNLPDRGKRAIETARHELYSDAQAAQGFPLLAQTAGVMDEHKVTVHAAWLVADGRVS